MNCILYKGTNWFVSSFKTPSKRAVAESSQSAELHLKYEKVCRELAAAQEEILKHKVEAENIRRSFESRISELESGVETKESELSSKLVQLERMSEERNSAESKLSALETELDEIRCRELTLAKEMELLNQVI